MKPPSSDDNPNDLQSLKAWLEYQIKAQPDPNTAPPTPSMLDPVDLSRDGYVLLRNSNSVLLKELNRVTKEQVLEGDELLPKNASRASRSLTKEVRELRESLRPEELALTEELMYGRFIQRQPPVEPTPFLDVLPSAESVDTFIYSAELAKSLDELPPIMDEMLEEVGITDLARSEPPAPPPVSAVPAPSFGPGPIGPSAVQPPSIIQSSVSTGAPIMTSPPVFNSPFPSVPHYFGPGFLPSWPVQPGIAPAQAVPGPPKASTSSIPVIQLPFVPPLNPPPSLPPSFLPYLAPASEPPIPPIPVPPSAPSAPPAPPSIPLYPSTLPQPQPPTEHLYPIPSPPPPPPSHLPGSSDPLSGVQAIDLSSILPSTFETTSPPNTPKGPSVSFPPLVVFS